MKRSISKRSAGAGFFEALVAALFLSALSSLPASAQSSAEASASTASSSFALSETIEWDNDIRSIRQSDIPNFAYKYDDYLQLSPAAAMILMRACGVEGRSRTGGQWLSAEAFSTAIMAVAVNGIKYSVRRLRPDESTRNSFPSGHTATAFMCATMLHKEYGWKYPWISFAGYTVATFTGASRIMNQRHWSTDVLAGALIGVGSVELGYLINDAIFKKKNLSDCWEPLVFDEDKSLSYYCLEALYGHRYGLGESALSGGMVAIQGDVPLHPRFSARLRLGINSLRQNGVDSYSAASDGLTSNFYDYLAGAVWNYPFCKGILGVEAGALVGGGYRSRNCPEAMKSVVSKGYGEILCGGAFSVRLGSNFKVRALVEYDLLLPVNHSILVAFGSSFFW